MTDRQLAFATLMGRYLKDANAPLSEFQQRLMVSAFRFAERELYGSKGRHPRCTRCYSDLMVGKVITVSPLANASFEFPLCMKHIQWMEAWIKNLTKKPEDFENLGSQTQL